MEFTVVYDNNVYDAALRTAWGFACWVETPEGRVLFDTGGDSPTLLGNLARMGLDSQVIDAVVLSHAHGDHTGGLAGLLDTGVRPMVYVPAAFPASFKENVGARADLVEVTGPVEIPRRLHNRPGGFGHRRAGIGGGDRGGPGRRHRLRPPRCRGDGAPGQGGFTLTPSLSLPGRGGGGAGAGRLPPEGHRPGPDRGHHRRSA